MDLLASQLAHGAKTKTTKKSKNDLKKEKIVAKVDSSSLSKPLKKKNLKKNVKETTDMQKELIKKSLTAPNDKKLVKLLKEMPSNILKSKNKKDIKNDKALKKNINETELISKGINNSSAIEKFSKKEKKNKNKLDILKQKKSNSTESNILKNDSTKENVKLSKKLKKQIVKSTKLGTTEQGKSNSLKTKVLKNNLIQKNIKLKKNKQQIAETTDSEENVIVEKKLKKNKISVTETEDKSVNSKKKKLKAESGKLSAENNEEIKNIKSKKRKLQEISKVDESENQFPSKKEVKKCVKALLKSVEVHEQKNNKLFNSEKPHIIMHITCIKVPKTPLHKIRMLLPHSLVAPTDDVALIVKDLKKGRRRDPEDSINHYKDILQQHGCTQIKTVIPLNQVKTEYRPFEMRTRLLNSHDYFLVDGCIAGHMAHLLGKTFREKRKMPTPIHMTRKDLKAEIDSALRKTSLQIHSNGDSSAVTIGTCSMSEEKIVDNIMAVIQYLDKDFPGGWANIRSLRIKTPLSIAIPIYLTFKSKNDVEVPVITPKRPKAYKSVEGELSTCTRNTKVIVSPEGTVTLYRTGNDSDEEIENDNDRKEVKDEKQNIITKTLNKKVDKAEVIEEKQAQSNIKDSKGSNEKSIKDSKPNSKTNSLDKKKIKVNIAKTKVKNGDQNNTADKNEVISKKVKGKKSNLKTKTLDKKAKVNKTKGKKVNVPTEIVIFGKND